MFACNCLNVILEADKSTEPVTNETVDLSSDDQFDAFFGDQWTVGKLRSISMVHPSLTRSVQIGQWLVRHCLNCGLYTHAVNKNKSTRSLLNAKLLDEEAANNVKSSDLVSAIFNVVVNPNGVDIDSSPIDTYLYRNLEEVINSLNGVVTCFIGKEQAAVEEKIRKYSEEQYELLNNLKEKAYNEREALVKIVQNAVKQNSTEFDLSPKSPKLFSNVTSNVQVTSNSSEISFSPKRPKSVVSETEQSKEIGARDDDMMIFTFEEFDELKTPFNEKTADDSESEEVEEAEDTVNTVEGTGVEIPQNSQSSSYGVAKSCPVNIPNFSRPARSVSRSKMVKCDGRRENEQFDIAASIKALAQSVHGDAIFGELPRPKFSTQI